MPEALPDLGALAAALVLILLAGALWVLADLIQNSFGRLPIVGGWISSNIVGALNDARNAVFGAAGATWSFAIQLFITIGNWLWRLPYSVIGAVNDAANFGVWVAQWLVPNTANVVQGYAYGLYRDALSFTSAVESWAGGYIQSAFAQATSYAASLYEDAVSYTSAVESWAGGYIASAFAQAQGYAYGLYQSVWGFTQSVETWASGAIATAESSAVAHADALFNVAEADISNVLSTAEAAISSATVGIAAGIYTDLDNVGAGVLQNVWPGIQDDIGALRNVLGQDFPDIQALLPWLAGAGAAGLSGALIRSIAGSAALTRLATDCIVPNCRNLSGLGNDLANLLGDASTAAMLAWFIFLVTDPNGWATETGEVGAPIAAATTTAAATLFGFIQ